MIEAATLSWALLIDALGWIFLVDKPTHHDNLSFIEGECWCNFVCLCLLANKWWFSFSKTLESLHNASRSFWKDMPVFQVLCLLYYYINFKQVTLHKKSSFPLRISSINVTKSQFPADLVTFTEEILNGKLHFLCIVNKRVFVFITLENFEIA